MNGFVLFHYCLNQTFNIEITKTFGSLLSGFCAVPRWENFICFANISFACSGMDLNKWLRGKI